MESLCRACLVLLNEDETDNRVHNLLQEQGLAIRYMKCTSLKFDVQDDFPKNICDQCYNILCKSYNFQQMCAESETNFKNLLMEQLQLKENVEFSSEENDDYNYSENYDDYSNCDNSDDNDCFDEFLGYKEYMNDISKDNNILVLENCDGVLKGKFIGIEETNLLNNVAATELNLDNIFLDNLIENTVSGKIVTEVNLEDKVQTTSEKLSKEKKPLSEIFRCDKCPKYFYKFNNLEAHTRIHSGLKPFLCTICGSQFARAENLNNHLKQTHKQVTNFFCCPYDECRLLFRTKNAFDRHIKQKHEKSIQVTEDKKQEQHICETCGKLFKLAVHLNRHRYIHMDKSKFPFACNYCEKRFYSKQFLTDHVNRHAGLKNFQCIICGKGKATKAALKVHMNSHTKEKSWNCKDCGKTFSSSSNLKTHQKNIHLHKKDFSCRFCEQTFAKADTLKNHEHRHTNTKPYKCNKCSRKFIQKSAFNTHIQNVH